MKIIYFANMKQIIGINQESFELKEKIKVRELIEILKKRNKNYSLAFNNSNIQCAVNCKYVDRNFIIKNTDEIAFFPPVTGG